MSIPHCGGRCRTWLRCPPPQWHACTSLKTHCCGRCCSCCCCGCGCAYCCGCSRKVNTQKQSVFTALSGLSLPFSFTISAHLPLRQSSGSLRPSSRRGPVRPLVWLLARFCAVPWRCACVVRGQHGSTTRFATTSCVCSTRGTHRALNSHLLLAPPWASTSLSCSVCSS